MRESNGQSCGKHNELVRYQTHRQVSAWGEPEQKTNEKNIIARSRCFTLGVQVIDTLLMNGFITVVARSGTNNCSLPGREIPSTKFLDSRVYETDERHEAQRERTGVREGREANEARKKMGRGEKL